MSKDEQTIGNDELAVSVEMGDDFEPGSRTSAALSELLDALNEEHGDDVAGFDFGEGAPVRSFSFVTPPVFSPPSSGPSASKWKSFELDGRSDS